MFDYCKEPMLPPGRGPMLRDGPALAIPDRDGETGPETRLLREGILIPDLMGAFNINVAVSMWPASPPGAVTPCGVSLAPPRSWRGWALPGEIQALRQEAIGQQVRQLRARVIPAAFPSGKPCHFWKGVNGKLKRGGRRPRIRDHRKPTATTKLGNLGIPSCRAPH